MGMLLRSVSTGAFEVYDISNNNITNAATLGAVGLDFQIAGFGDFNRDGSTDMVLRNKTTGQFEVYDISNNAITSAPNLGTIGLNFQVAGFGDFNGDGTSDMMLRSVSTGQFERLELLKEAVPRVKHASPRRLLTRALDPGFHARALRPSPPSARVFLRRSGRT
jgi:hypothetical protein